MPATSRAPPKGGCWPARRPCTGPLWRTRSACSTGRSPSRRRSRARGRGRCWPAQPSTRPARDFASALADVDAALALARSTREPPTGDGGPALPAAATPRSDSGSPSTSWSDPLEEGLRLAADLGDRRAEADFSSRLAILEASRLRLTTALARAERSVARARAADSEDALILALDGLKSVLGYLGDPEPLGEVVADLEPRVRARGNTWLLQWVVFESSFVPAAEGRLDAARARVAEAIELNRLSGFPAYAGYLAAHDGWYARLSGDLDAARRIGRKAVEATSPVNHPWWYAIAAGLLAATLVETGDRAEAEAVAAARAGGGRDRDGRRSPALPRRRRGPR